MRRICIIVLLCTMFIPMLQKLLPVFPQDYALAGYADQAGKPVFSLKSFLSGDFQDQFTDYMQDNVGYRGYLIAIKNQVDYALFHILHYTIEEGKEGQLFYWNHIDTHCGHLMLDSNTLFQKMQEYKQLKVLLNERNIKLLYVLAPGKPNFYEDKLPEKYAGKCQGSNNDYTALLNALNAGQFELIDFNAWFKNNRDTFSYPVFPRLGTHWSFYAACIAMDSLSRYISSASGIAIPPYKPAHIRLTDQPYTTDKDLASLLNLLFPLKSDTLAYPEYVFDPPSARKKPKVLFIGDSFTWNLIDTKLPGDMFSADSRYWFHGHGLYDLKGNWITNDVSNADELLNGTQMVIFLATEVSDHNVDFEFFHSLKNKPAL